MKPPKPTTAIEDEIWAILEEYRLMLPAKLNQTHKTATQISNLLLESYKKGVADERAKWQKVVQEIEKTNDILEKALKAHSNRGDRDEK